MFGLLVAQESVTSATVRWVIAALLLVAALLTILTVWYWHHTDPRRRVRPAPVIDRAAPAQTDALAVPANGAWIDPAQASASDPWAASMVPSSDDEIEADDWLRLTGPQSLPRDKA